MLTRVRTVAPCALAGLCIAASLPPWGWWPLAFVGIALTDRVLAGKPWRTRFLRMWVVAAFWLFPATLWMIDLTPPGYVFAQAAAAAMFGLAAAAVPANGNARRVGLVGAITLAEIVRWSWPFGGVPLATLAMGQAASPLAPVVRTLGSLLLVALTVIVGLALAAALERSWRAVGASVAIVVLCIGWAGFAPRGHVVRAIDIAVVQGGGKQRTRANPEDNPLVFARHVDATRSIDRPVDLVVWPENVVNPRAMYINEPKSPKYLYADDAAATLADLARTLHTTIIPGWFYAIDETQTVNYSEVVTPDGITTDRYDKVRMVPFGEFVPLRSLLDTLGVTGLPPRDARPGTKPAVLDTPVGRVGVSISWEIFFDHRARDAIGNGGQLLLNPTNGASYWLTILQTQQVASSRLRALETGRWVVQAAPTGFSAVISPDGTVRQRTSVSEEKVLYDTVEMREGLTLATRLGAWPMLVIAGLLLAGAQLVPWGLRRRMTPDEPGIEASDVDDDRDGAVVHE
jgi:apolipoprotein N-acyltransferase